MSERHFNFSIHVLSQLAYKWLPPLPFSDVLAPPLQKMDVEDWGGLLNLINSGLDPKDFPSHCRAINKIGVSHWAKACWSHFHASSEAGCSILVLGDQSYPVLLREISDPPLSISCFGNLQALNRDSIAVIGSRKCSGFGLKQSFRLGLELADHKYSVVSGGALGCDIAAHQGTLASRDPVAKAIVVFAGGLKTFYPRANSPIFRELHAQGSLFVSERLWKASCKPMDFPARNRIISGLCRTTVVMQAGGRSGALITARVALDQGREVICLEHDLLDIRAVGTHALISEGACGFSSAGEIVDHLA
jgi:DNA processing protein